MAEENAKGSVPGQAGEKRIEFFGLSTCVWCRRCRQFLEKEKLGFDFVYMDLVPPAEKQEILQRLRRWNSRVSYPTVVVDDSCCIVGFFPDKIKEALKR